MPSTIATFDETRTYSVKPAKGLRYGNFEGVRNLPPIRKTENFIEQNLWSMNNEQIYRTVCQWMETWQPWQQRTLLCGIANRCTVSQLEILSTTLEPLKHRDYRTISLRRYPSAPFRTKNLTTVCNLKKGKHGKHLSVKSGKAQRNLIVAEDGDISSGFQCNNLKVEGISDVDNEHAANAFPGCKEAIQGDNSAKDLSVDIAVCPAATLLNREESEVPEKVDEYVSLLTSTIMNSAVNDSALLTYYDKVQFSNSREGTDTSASQVKVEEPEEFESKPSQSKDTVLQKQKGVQSEHQASMEFFMREIQNSHGILKSPHGKKVDSSRMASGRKSGRVSNSSRMSSARFLGGTLEFASNSYGKELLRTRSSSSHIRHSVFASSAASTSDFFDRKKLAVLGPMKRPIRSGCVHKPIGLSSLPTSLQKYYKHSRWWPNDPQDDRIYHQARKHDLATNFKEQLATIWDWLRDWEGYERISFTKEVAKMCSAEVLDALMSHIQQRLRDARDINRLPDKLVLYILSFLPAHDILESAKVCRRWRYLCAMDDLWIVKCLELGEREGVYNMMELIQEVLAQGMSIDWMLAFCELSKLIESLSQANLESVQDSLPSEEDEDKVIQLWKGMIRPIAVDYTAEREMSTEEKRKTSKSNVRIPAHPEWTKTRKSASQKLAAQTPLMEETTPVTSSSNRNISSKSSKHSSKKKEKAKDTALDIRTDLAQSKDILGKMVGRTSLEWETPDTYNDYMRTTLYAGEVKGVKRMRKIQGHVNSINCISFDKRRLITCGLDRVIRLWDVRSGRSVHKFLGHKGGIRCMQFDNNILATGAWDCLILIWDMKKFTNSFTLRGHEESVTCLEFNDDLLISGSEDKTVRLWRRPTFSCMLTVHFDAPVLSLVIVDHTFVVSTADLMYAKQEEFEDVTRAAANGKMNVGQTRVMC